MKNSNLLRRNIVFLICCACLFSIFFLFKRASSKNRIEDSYAVNTALNKEVINLQEAFIDVANNVKTSVVAIYTEQIIKEVVPFDYFFSDPFDGFFNEFFGAPQPKQRSPRRRNYSYQRRQEGAGSGVIINKDGYVLTNYHVVQNADKITVKLYDDKEYIGKVIGKDSKTDLAVIKIKRPGKFPAAVLGDSDKIQVGEWAIAIGSPFGLEQTVTVGIISAKRQSMRIRENHYRDLIQTDASINMGNSGGPLVNIHGEVVGINTAIFTQTGGSVGVGFAIPINRAKEILDPLITKGKVERGYLGVTIMPVDDVIAKQSGLKATTGVIIESVMEGTAAEKAGLQRGDIIMEFSGQKIDSIEKLQSIVASSQPSKKIKTLIVRNGEKKTIEILLGEWPNEDAVSKPASRELSSAKKTANWNGLIVKEINKDIAEQFNIVSHDEGVIVIEIEQGSRAEEMGIAVGDIIRAINKQKTLTLAEFETATKKVRLKDGVLFDVNRNGHLMYKTYIER